MAQHRRPTGRRAWRIRGERLHATLTQTALARCRWQSQGRTRGVGVLAGGSHSCEKRGVPIAGISMFRPSLAHRPLRWLRIGGPQVRKSAALRLPTGRTAHRE
jgi:hypothetical protein